MILKHYPCGGGKGVILEKDWRKIVDIWIQESIKYTLSFSALEIFEASVALPLLYTNPLLLSCDWLEYAPVVDWLK